MVSMTAAQKPTLTRSARLIPKKALQFKLPPSICFTPNCPTSCILPSTEPGIKSAEVLCTAANLDARAVPRFQLREVQQNQWFPKVRSSVEREMRVRIPAEGIDLGPKFPHISTVITHGFVILTLSVLCEGEGPPTAVATVLLRGILTER